MKLLHLVGFTLSVFLTASVYAQDDYVIADKKNAKASLKKDIYTVPNPDYTSYFISPTAYTITKRDFRIANNDLLFLKLTYGLSSNTNISLNTSLFGSLIGSLKHQLKVDEEKSIALSASFGEFFMTLKDTSVMFSGVDACFTLGNHQNNLSFGTGFWFINSNIEMIQNKKQFYAHSINFGIQSQLAKKIYVMVDGYYFTNYSMFAGAAGLKFIIKTRYALNLGVMPMLRNDIRNNRYDIKPFVLPVASFRMLIERRD